MNKQFNTFKSQVVPKLAVGAAVAMPLLSHAVDATSFDPAQYVLQIVAAVAGVLAVGGAVFGLNVAIKSTKWARRAL